MAGSILNPEGGPDGLESGGSETIFESLEDAVSELVTYVDIDTAFYQGPALPMHEFHWETMSSGSAMESGRLGFMMKMFLVAVGTQNARHVEGATLGQCIDMLTQWEMKSMAQSEAIQSASEDRADAALRNELGGVEVEGGHWAAVPGASFNRVHHPNAGKDVGSDPEHGTE